ncbi:hypothetical protein LTR36_000328 [Oleoguttula mirabilis]|uniref:Major facilitator superfamily (MFS) profile domain-containing protein n=1 Tax=Oleoguttula mirabilis TaxID=1507867 RepID=A0AAV9JYL5_9PEZI|nr:hypothetical protein LTR36_000328 [Oleoguttula mirabilis]
MTEKIAVDAAYDSHDEKHHGHQPDLTETAGRRASVALNLVENPLKRSSPEKAVLDGRAFAEKHGMPEHAELFGKAALVARDPQRFESVMELTEPERSALVYERDHKWHGPKMLWYSISLCAIGAATQGWDQTGSNGANLSFPEEFNIAGKGTDEWIVGSINAIIFLTAGLIGAFIVDPLNHYFGRRGEIFITALCLTACPIGSGFAKSWQGLFAARFVLGIGIGAKNATVPIYSAEMAPARIRGALVMFWQLWVVAGIFLGFCANVIVKDTGRIAWRLQLGSAFIPSFILGCGIWFCPESPRWLMKHNRHAQGFKSMLVLRAHPIIAARDFYYSNVIYEEELKEHHGANYFTRMWDCFRVPRIRRANYGASTVMIAQQMCGINIISFYSSTIFENVGYTATQALYASLGYGAIQVVFTIPTLFLIDTKAAGLSLLETTGTKGARIGPVVLFVYLFTICYSLGEGPVAFQYSAEVFPTIQREQGMAWAVCINNTFAGILSLTFPRMQTVMTPTGAFGFYAGLNLIAWFMIFCFVRETKQLTLEEIDQVFSIPTKTFIGYELNVSVPYFIKRTILRRKIPKPLPLLEKGEKEDDSILVGINSTLPGVIIDSYEEKTLARSLGAVTEEQHVALVQRAMIETQGAIAQEQFTGAYDRICWESNEYQAGAGCDSLVGRQDLYLPAYFHTERHTVFLGGHTSYTHAWIWRALESAVRGTSQLLLDIGLVDEANEITKLWMASWISIIQGSIANIAKKKRGAGEGDTGVEKKRQRVQEGGRVQSPITISDDETPESTTPNTNPRRTGHSTADADGAAMNRENKKAGKRTKAKHAKASRSNGSSDEAQGTTAAANEDVTGTKRDRVGRSSAPEMTSPPDRVPGISPLPTSVPTTNGVYSSMIASTYDINAAGSMVLRSSAIQAPPAGKSGKDLSFCRTSELRQGHLVLASQDGGRTYVPAVVIGVPKAKGTRFYAGQYAIRFVHDGNASGNAPAHRARRQLYLMFSDSPTMIDYTKKAAYDQKSGDGSGETEEEEEETRNLPDDMVQAQMNVARTIHGLRYSTNATNWDSVAARKFSKLGFGNHGSAVVPAVQQTGDHLGAGMLSVANTNETELVRWVPVPTPGVQARVRTILIADLSKVFYSYEARGLVVRFKFTMKNGTNDEEFAMPSTVVEAAIACGKAMGSKLAAAARAARKSRPPKEAARPSTAGTRATPADTTAPAADAAARARTAADLYVGDDDGTTGYLQGIEGGHPLCEYCGQPLLPEELTAGECLPECT